MGELIAEIFLKWILGGIWVTSNVIYDWIKSLIFGISKNEVERKRIEKNGSTKG